MNAVDVAVLSILAAIAIVMQVFATLRVRTSASYAVEQKRAQVKLIWFLPVLGAAMVMTVLHQDGELFAKSRTTQQGPRS